MVNDEQPWAAWLRAEGSAIASSVRFDPVIHAEGNLMSNIVYIVGLVVIVVAVLSFFGLR